MNYAKNNRVKNYTEKDALLDVDKVLENVNRPQKKENVEKIVDLARALNFEELAFDVIYGLPFQTVDSMAETFKQIIEMSPELVAFYPHATVPWQRKGQMAFGDFSPPTL